MCAKLLAVAASAGTKKKAVAPSARLSRTGKRVE